MTIAARLQVNAGKDVLVETVDVTLMDDPIVVAGLQGARGPEFLGSVA
jgi:hypothetical protein